MRGLEDTGNRVTSPAPCWGLIRGELNYRGFSSG